MKVNCSYPCSTFHTAIKIVNGSVEMGAVYGERPLLTDAVICFLNLNLYCKRKKKNTYKKISRFVSAKFIA